MQISSNDGSQRREERLVKFRKVAATMLGMTPDQLDMLVASIHDHKGNLEVKWIKHLPSPQQKVAFSSAWELGGESRLTVYHEVAQSNGTEGV